MGEKALAYLLRHEWRNLPRWKHVIKEIGMDEPVVKDLQGTIESILADTEFMKSDEKFRRAFMQTSFYNEVFETKMASLTRSFQYNWKSVHSINVHGI